MDKKKIDVLTTAKELFDRCVTGWVDVFSMAKASLVGKLTSLKVKGILSTAVEQPHDAALLNEGTLSSFNSNSCSFPLE